MGLEEHVCEVQLILLPMYQLKVRLGEDGGQPA